MGTDDYIQRMFPEDEMSLVGSYFMIRSFPAFSKQRLALIEPCNDPFSDIYKVDTQSLTREAKGNSIVVGLWMFAPDARQAMTVVMERQVPSTSNTRDISHSCTLVCINVPKIIFPIPTT
jgi:hypothetical protein